MRRYCLLDGTNKLTTLVNAWGHLAIKVPNVYSASRYLKKHGVEFTKEPSPMKGGTRILAFIKDPDGYPIELNEPLGEHISNDTC